MEFLTSVTKEILPTPALFLEIKQTSHIVCVSFYSTPSLQLEVPRIRQQCVRWMQWLSDDAVRKIPEQTSSLYPASTLPNVRLARHQTIGTWDLYIDSICTESVRKCSKAQPCSSSTSSTTPLRPHRPLSPHHHLRITLLAVRKHCNSSLTPHFPY